MIQTELNSAQLEHPKFEPPPFQRSQIFSERFKSSRTIQLVSPVARPLPASCSLPSSPPFPPVAHHHLDPLLQLATLLPAHSSHPSCTIYLTPSRTCRPPTRNALPARPLPLLATLPPAACYLPDPLQLQRTCEERLSILDTL